MAESRKTVGVYERPERPAGLRAALIAATVIVVAAGAAAAVFLL